MKRNERRRGVSYMKRVEEVNAIYDKWAKHGVPNREIWRRHVWPKFGISERTFYNMMNATANPKNDIPEDTRQLLLFNFDETDD